ncbi:YdiU family protein [Shewanella corallii]|uniref:Protein nucleotidyltransferase YdiU n=1 Tax=Shewanella corallii TaxID=560080 RepID=A0ABT0NCN4_9GAMM|nr:YdiU family protein [Shewanella corallii]MCL2916242.1 YdiU family protein [Shewanella corallii]
MELRQDFVNQLPGAYSLVEPEGLDNPRWLMWSQDAAHMLNLAEPDANALAVFSGNARMQDASYYAQVYAGHQFGGYSPRLGDGRAMILGEAKDIHGEFWDIALKGAGKTPYSRHGDGKAVLRSAVREFLASEALYHLGIPTTRALAVVGSDTPVWRETQETGAITVRLARSHIRFGHFEYITHGEQDRGRLRELVNFTIAHHFPHLEANASGYKAWFAEVVRLTAEMIAHWQASGFAHGVMNTDNMSILGDTFDFGPFSFLDTYQEGFICNHSDPHGRYAFDQQPGIGLWNLQRLAQALVPLIPSDDLMAGLNGYQQALVDKYLQLMRNRLGIVAADEGTDLALVGGLMKLMQNNHLDYTNSMRAFAGFEPGAMEFALRDECRDTAEFDDWFSAYRDRVNGVADAGDWQRQRAAANPKYILRNYLAQQAIEAAEAGDNQPLETLYQLLRNPFDEQADMTQYARRPPDWGEGLICSCSS